MPDFSLESAVLTAAGPPYPFVAGVDEVGMGALAGPIVAASVVLCDYGEPPPWVGDLDDSKRLSPRKRERLYSLIMGGATAVGVGWAMNMEIDSDGIVAAHSRAIVQAFSECRTALRGAGLAAVVDGEDLDYLRGELGGGASIFRNRADSRSCSVAAASIVAKVTRDFYMIMSRNTYPRHLFEVHKGYGTAAHLEALGRWGVTPLHRRSFRPVRGGNFPEYVR